ncbi:TGBp3 [Camellia ringspot associated virus 4]|uniref:Movement protein TGBp3 n=1 Tax=Camellia ringspot associated virus 4 TaxID=2791164 RepID=A0A7S9TQG7_9VIRU|nr:TGBp3 [Camellia ringspot associated virus 4]QPI34841.1 TGBp3 [Camellia ringspot associated virus 4]
MLLRNSLIAALAFAGIVVVLRTIEQLFSSSQSSCFIKITGESVVVSGCDFGNIEFIELVKELKPFKHEL